MPISLMPNPTGWREAWPTPSELGGEARAMIPIGDDLALDERELEESFIRASGPGGQNVNKVASAVQLRFDLRHSRSLPEPVRMRLPPAPAPRGARGGGA